MAFAPSPLKAAPAVDGEPIRKLFHTNPHTTELSSNSPDAIGLLDPELCGVPDDGLSFGARGGHRQDRDLINQAGNQVSPDGDSPQAARTNPEMGVRLSDLFVYRKHLHLPPIVWRTSKRPVRVGFTPTPSMVRSESGRMRPATSRKAADEKSPGTEIGVAWKGPCWDERHLPLSPLHPLPVGREHALGMIPRGCGLDDGRRSLGKEARQEDRGFHLGRRNRAAVRHPDKAPPRTAKGGSVS